MEDLDKIKIVVDFYELAWNKLIIAGSLLITLFGIAIPLLSTYFNRRAIKAEKKELAAELNSYIDDKIGDIESELFNKLKLEVKALKRKLKKAEYSSDSSTFHLQGNKHLSEGKKVNALADFLISFLYCLKARDFVNLRQVHSIIMSKELNLVTKNQLENIMSFYGYESLDNYIEVIRKQKNVSNGAYEIKQVIHRLMNIE